MRRPVLFGALAATTCVVLLGGHFTKSSPDVFSDPAVTPPEAAPLCPWRQPEADLKEFFPGATRSEIQTGILSGLRPELARRLGRVPTGDENALRLARVYRDQAVAGSILTRRVKGEHGAIEIVLAVDTNLSVVGVRLQRLREPESIAHALEDTNWLGAFNGKRAEDAWHLGTDVAPVPAEARASAEALVEGLRSLLILTAAANGAEAPKLAASHH